jgi:hypothetical protein
MTALTTGVRLTQGDGDENAEGTDKGVAGIGKERPEGDFAGVGSESPSNGRGIRRLGRSPTKTCCENLSLLRTGFSPEAEDPKLLRSRLSGRFLCPTKPSLASHP